MNELWIDYSTSIIKKDLDLLLSTIDTPRCGVWNTIEGFDSFWNRIMTRKALDSGFKFTALMGDHASSAAYMEASNSIADSLLPYTDRIGFETQPLSLDASVVLAFNYGFIDSDPLFSPSSSSVANSIAALNSVFCAEISANRHIPDSLSGALYGRFAGDSLDEPSVVASASLALLFYRAASYTLRRGLSTNSVNRWKAMNSELELPQSALDRADMFAKQGDGVLQRLKHHFPDMTAQDPWSVLEVLVAVHRRSEYFETLQLLSDEQEL